MDWHLETDDNDPIARAYRRYLQRLIVLGVVVMALVVVAYLVGVPHLQVTYTYLGPRNPSGFVDSSRKLDAWYLGPFGWQLVRSGQYGQVGCPYIVFVPPQDCLAE